MVYDFAVNIEKSDLKYRDATKRKFLAVVEGTDAQGKTIRIERGTTGGDKFTLKLPGVSDRKSLEQRADEEPGRHYRKTYRGKWITHRR